MKDFEARYDHFGACIVRQPVVSSTRWPHAIESNGDGTRGDRSRFAAMLADAEIRAALQHASPILYSELERHGFALEALPTKAYGSVVKYLARMTFRPTPFGLFATWGMAAIEGNEPSIGGQGVTYARGRLDSAIAVALAANSVNTPTLLHLAVRPNPTLFRVEGGYHYVERRLHGKSEAIELARVEASQPLERVLDICAGGASVEVVSRALSEFTDEPEEALAFIRELCVESVLVSSAAISSLQPDPLKQLIGNAPDVALGGEFPLLREVLDSLAGSHTRQTEAFGAQLVAQERRVHAVLLKHGIADMTSPIFQIDSWSSSKSHIPSAVAREILDILPAYHRASVREEDPLGSFITQFLDRYDRAEVPFLEAMDEIVGMGEVVKRIETNPAGSALPVSPINDLLLRRIGQAIVERSEEVQLQPTEIVSIDGPPRMLPPSLSIVFSLTDVNGATPLRPFIHGVRGASAAGMLGRISDLAPDVETLMRRITTCEAQHVGGAVIAEVDFLPPGRHGNVAFRSACREHRIDLSGAPAPHDTRDIPLADLFLSLTPGGRLRLRSGALNREVVPRITTAHNYDHTRNPPIYRFLGMLQHHQHLGPVSFAAGVGGGLPHVPRIVLGGVIVTRATWRLYADELRMIKPLRGHAARAAMCSLLMKRGVPHSFWLADGDNMLMVHMDDVDLLDAFVEEVRRRTYCVVVEPLQAITLRENGSTSGHEFILPAILKQPRPTADGPPPALSLRSTGRRKDFGSEWFTCYIYIPEAITDTVLCSEIQPVMLRLEETGTIKGWFFVRYGDPDWHLRLRIRVRDTDHHAHVSFTLSEMLQRLTSLGKCRTYRIVPYLREIERYGGDDVLGAIEDFWMAECAQFAELLLKRPALREASRRIAWCALQMCHVTRAVLAKPEADQVLILARDQMHARLPSSLHHSAFESSCFATIRTGVGRATTREALMYWLDLSSQRPDCADRYTAALQNVRERLATLQKGERHRIASSIVHMLANHCLSTSGGKEEFAAYGVACRALRAEWAIQQISASPQSPS